MKVLIVDGEKDERTKLVEAFGQFPEVVVIGAVARLHTALHALGEAPPDVIVTDNALGDDHATHLIAAARRCIVPPAIVVFAASDAVDERRRCLEAGADRFVAKAAGVGALHRAMTDALATRTRASTIDRYSLIGRVAAGVAHDLNNYLGVIDVALGLMKKRLADQGLNGEVTSLRRAVESATKLSTTMTRYARGSTPPFGAVDLGAVIRRVIELFRHAFPEDVALTVALDPVPPIDGSEIEIEQLVLNLVLNASEAGTDEVFVRVFAPEPSVVRLEIVDHGSGVADADTSTKRDGAGLGLGIVRNIARRHSARFRLASEQPRGTRATVDFEPRPQ